MMYSFFESAVIKGDIAKIWAVATDVTRWADWDPHEEKSRIDGEFEAGTKGWVKPKGAPAGPFTITDVVAGESWTSEAGLPFGKLRGHRTYEPLGDGTVRVAEHVEVHGPMGPLFRLIWEKGMRADMPRTFAALEREALRRG
ncbi:SRPBCC family protein [Nocardia yamanashiensis]|uniref:SRPBCC family protein n=1 Tax=Nocardia yamanashiensis TaxID=209247 RepID=UPI000832E772|nr:SRPBCC family protein [Nocardia yamanashiensis]